MVKKSVLKTEERNCLGGSNPSASAKDFLHVVSTNQAVSVMWLPEGGWKPAIVQASNMGSHWYLNRAMVPEAYRGQGVGSKLLKELFAQLDMHKAGLLIVEPGGYGADPKKQRNFYLKNGFVESKQYKGALEYGQFPHKEASRRKSG